MADWRTIFITPQMYADMLDGHRIFSSAYRHGLGRDGRYSWSTTAVKAVNVPVKINLEGVEYALAPVDGELRIASIVWPSQGVDVYGDNIVSINGCLLKLGEKAPTTVIGNPPCCSKARVVEEGGYHCVCLTRCWCPEHGGPDCVGTHD